MMKSIRFTDFLAFILCCLLLGSAFYLEIVYKLEPCPLCIIQRLIFAAMGVLFLIGSFLALREKPNRYYHLFIAFVGALGIITAGRHVWIEHLPANQVPACGASLKYLLQVLPFNQAMQVIFQGTGSCAKVTWRFLGLSLASWSLIVFIVLTGFSVWQGFRKTITR